jgi:hypothetical protein
VVDETNRQWHELKTSTKSLQERQRSHEEAHRRHVEDVSGRIRFD